MDRPMCTLATLVALAVLMVPAAGAGESPACASIGDSALPPPAWYVALCGSSAVVEQPAPGPWRVPGDPVYFVSLFSTVPANNRRLLRAPIPVAPIPTLTYTDLGPASVAPMTIFALDFDNAADMLWAIDSTCGATCTGRSFGTINLTTGVFTPVGVVAAPPNGPPVGANFAGIRFDPTDGTVYVATIFGNPAQSQLWSLDLGTGNATLRGNMGAAGQLIIDIAISNTGVMYAHNISTDTIHTVDKANGALTLVGPTGQNYNFAQGMDFDNSDNNLYLFGQTPNAGVAHFARVNLATGAVTILANATEELEGAVDVPVAVVELAATALTVDSAGNGVIEPSEAVVVAPTWSNVGTIAAQSVTGTFANFTGPSGGTYTILDASGVYGNIAVGASATCASPTDCYTVQASAATRPQLHWDTAVEETLNIGGLSDTYTLHIGGSFTDVPTTNAFYSFVETILHRGITGGCTATAYCPANSTIREQMSVFVLIAKEGAGYTPAPCTTPVFSDVPANSPFCPFIEELSRRGVTAGCATNPARYCPGDPVSRAQMAVFVLRTLDPTLDPPACTTPIFTDVPANDPFCRWIEELFRRGVVTGCAPNQYCPNNPVTREQMGVFLTETFSLTLYGV